MISATALDPNRPTLTTVTAEFASPASLIGHLYYANKRRKSMSRGAPVRRAGCVLKSILVQRTNQDVGIHRDPVSGGLLRAHPERKPAARDRTRRGYLLSDQAKIVRPLFQELLRSASARCLCQT
jgi:hypothetical protein